MWAVFFFSFTKNLYFEHFFKKSEFYTKTIPLHEKTIPFEAVVKICTRKYKNDTIIEYPGWSNIVHFGIHESNSKTRLQNNSTSVNSKESRGVMKNMFG